MTGTRPQPHSAATAAVSRPTTVPGLTICGRRSAGRSSRASSSADHSPVRMSAICEVLASVYSAKVSPQSACATRSAMNISRRARASAGSLRRRMARSWKSELIRLNWMPVRSYTSRFGTRRNASSSIPSVWRSR